MHQLLRLENLSHLPPSLQRLAVSALPRGTWENFGRLIQHLGRNRDTQLWASFLPVYYANLDPAGIPTEPDVTTVAVRRATAVLDTLRLALQLSDAPAGMDLWPRIWKWTNFLHTHRDRTLPRTVDQYASVGLLYFVGFLSEDTDTMALMSGTPGVRAILMHGFASLLDTDLGEEHRGFVHLTTILRNFMAADQPANLAEILEATKGRAGLATLVVRYIQFLRPLRGAEIAERTIYLYDGIAGFILTMTPDWEAIDANASADIAIALVSAGIVAPLTSVIRTISDCSVIYEDVDATLLDCLKALAQLFIPPGSHRAIADAISAGLLRALIRCSIVCDKSSRNVQASALRRLLAFILPGSTAYHTVVARLEARMHDVEALVKSEAFKDSGMYGDWCSFADLASRRIGLLNDRAAEEHVTLKACDNMECGLIQSKIGFRRCSHCQQVFYCSPGCQIKDWKAGHRQTCESLYISRHNISHIGPRNLSFMRSLLHCDSFQIFGHDQLRQALLALMQDNPGKPIVTVIDYWNGKARPEFKLLEQQRAADENHDVCWDEYAARAARSGGRMELHLMLAWDGAVLRQIMFPQHLEHSMIHDGFVRISRDIAGVVEQRKEMQRLMHESRDVLCIHQ
ncbi:hypothetical protein C8R47DRAFT_1329793 [Mycena vitilis]|nr:hypothetical protein C8R47DRAFT_1329793 [Mycena vitilis]